MPRLSRYGLLAAVLGMGLAACSSSDDAPAASTVRPDIGPAPTKSASLMTTDDGARAISAALRVQRLVITAAENPAQAAAAFRSAPAQRSDSAIPQQRQVTNCSDGGTVDINSNGSTVTADFANCRSVSNSGSVSRTTVLDGRSSATGASCGSGCLEGTARAGSGGTSLLSNFTETNNGTTTQRASTQILGSTHARRENKPAGGTSNVFTDIRLTIDIQDLLDGTQLTLVTNPATAGATALALELDADGNSQPETGKIDGSYGIANLVGCQDGVLTVQTDVDLAFTNSSLGPIVTGGQLTFTNEAAEMAIVTFAANGDVTVNAGGSSQTYNVGQIAAFCNL